MKRGTDLVALSATGFGLAVLAASRQQRAGEVAELVVVLFCAFNCGGSDLAELLLPGLGLELTLELLIIISIGSFSSPVP